MEEQEQKENLDTESLSPTYDEVVGALRAQLEEARFQIMVMELAHQKYRTRIAQLESEEGPW